MGTIEEYSTGAILESISKVLRFFESTSGPLGSEQKGLQLQQKIQAFEPLILTFAEASEYIRDATTIALGERVCRALHPESLSTESVFLDELAIEMIRSGKARAVTVEDAESSLRANSGHPLIISKVSGRYQEICASCKADCVFWRAEKRGLHCLKRKNI